MNSTSAGRFADLHLHTYFSDGTYSPDELVAQAARQALAVVALTDHDTVEGCQPTASACQTAGIEFITGTELTAEQAGHEIHILGYSIDLQHPRFLKEIGKFQAVRQNRIREMVQRLNQVNVPLHADQVFALANCRAPGRPHVARALVKKNRPAWVPKFKMSAAEATELIHEAGGVAVMAHPGLNRSDEVIPGMVDDGLDGIECFHTKHSQAISEHYLHIAEKFGLLVTGGSDCHGLSKGRPLIGSVKLPYEHVEKLKAKVAERRAATSGQFSA
jgi:predicted metal-dependent phosphoesterase TrpH